MSLKKLNYQLALLFMGLIIVFTSCKKDDEEVELLGDWKKSTTLNGDARSAAVSFVIGDKAYIATGVNEDGDRLSDIWEFNSSTSAWLKMESMPAEAEPRSDAVAFSIGNIGYVGLGMNDSGDELKDFWAYNTQTNTWSRIADFPDDEDAPERRSAIGFSVNNLGYAGLGVDINGKGRKDFYEYNPSTDEWTNIGFLGDKTVDASVFVIGTDAYLVGGANDNQNIGEFFKFDGNSKTWSKLNAIYDKSDEDYDDDYTSIMRKQAVAFTLNDKGYFVTGSNSSSLQNVWEYDPITDTWQEKTSFEGGQRIEAVGFAIGNSGYVATGRSSTTSYTYDDMWVFDPNAEADDNW